MKPDTQATIDFLHLLRPQGPWNIVAIQPDGKGICGATFHPGDENGVLAFLESNKKRNIYYTLNPTLRDIQKKPSRADIEELAWLHVDLDPRAREDVGDEQERILTLCGKMKPEPTMVVYSGGGYQCLWKINDPMKIDGCEDAFEEAKLYNLQLEIQYGADHCHNVDRIMRLPGTINWPDKKKQAKGRVPALAKVETFNDVSYSLSDFTKAPQVQSADKGFSGNTVHVPGNVKRLDDLDDLPVGDKCKRVIAMGHDPDEPSKWDSRSEPCWWVICEMVRQGVDNETIYAIITDPDWSISEHVLAQSRPHDYALRQLERAADYAIDPRLSEMNDQFAVVQVGGTVRILKESEIPIGRGENRSVVDYMTWADFGNFFSNKFIEIVGANDNNIRIPLGKWWQTHEQRRTYKGVCFVPGRECPGYYNLWKGFAYDARPGECGLFLNHVKDNVCQGSDEWNRYLLGWMARMIQHPDRPGEVAIVLRGKPGTGKGFLANQRGKLLGRQYLPVRDSNHIFGRFTQHLQECVFLFADEAFWAGNKKQEGMLKSLITEDTVLVEGKGTNAQISENFMHLMMASNEDWVVPVGSFDRRFFVLDVGDGNRRDRGYFSNIVAELENGGYEALLHYLLTYDILDYDVTDVPSTSAHKEQTMFTLEPIQEWWYSKLQDGIVFHIAGEWPARVWANELQHDLTDYLRTWSVKGTGNASILGRFMRQVLPEGYDRGQSNKSASVRQANGDRLMVSRPYFYDLPSLDAAREQWDVTFGAAKWQAPIIPTDTGDPEPEDSNY